MDVFDQHNLRLQLEKLVIGLEEEIKIKGIGDFDAKIDSGNGGYNVIHGENVFQQGDVVTFTTITKEGTKHVSKKIRRFVKINIGSGNIEERPVILLDVEIAGNEYKNIPFSVANRTNNAQKVLICKGFVKNNLNALIDVSQKKISDKGIRVNYIQESASKSERIRDKINKATDPPKKLEEIKNKVNKATDPPDPEKIQKVLDKVNKATEPPKKAEEIKDKINRATDPPNPLKKDKEEEEDKKEETKTEEKQESETQEKATQTEDQPSEKRNQEQTEASAKGEQQPTEQQTGSDTAPEQNTHPETQGGGENTPPPENTPQATEEPAPEQKNELATVSGDKQPANNAGNGENTSPSGDNDVQLIGNGEGGRQQVPIPPNPFPKDKDQNKKETGINTDNDDNANAVTKEKTKKEERGDTFWKRLNRAFHETGRFGNASFPGERAADSSKEYTSLAKGDKELIRKEMNRKNFGSSYFHYDKNTQIEARDLIIYKFIDYFGNFYDGKQPTPCEREDVTRYKQFIKNPLAPTTGKEQPQREEKSNNSNQVREAVEPQPQEQLENQNQQPPPQPQQQTGTTPVGNNQATQKEEKGDEPIKLPNDPERDRVVKMYSDRQEFMCYFVEVEPNIMSKSAQHDRRVKQTNVQCKFPNIVETFFQAFRRAVPKFQISVGEVNIRDRFVAIIYNIYNKLKEKDRFQGAFALCWDNQNNRKAVVWENMVLGKKPGTIAQVGELTEAGKGLQTEYKGYKDEWSGNFVLQFQPLSLKENGTNLDKLYDTVTADLEKFDSTNSEENKPTENQEQPNNENSSQEENAEEPQQNKNNTNSAPNPNQNKQDLPDAEINIDDDEDADNSENSVESDSNPDAPIDSHLDKIVKLIHDPNTLRKTVNDALSLIKNIQTFISKKEQVTDEEWEKIINDNYIPSEETMNQLTELDDEEQQKEESKADNIDEEAFFNLSKDELIEKWKNNSVLSVIEYQDEINLLTVKRAALDRIKELSNTENSNPSESEETIVRHRNRKSKSKRTPSLLEQFLYEDGQIPEPNFQPKEEQQQVNSDDLLQKLTDSVKQCVKRDVLVDAIQILAALQKNKHQAKSDEIKQKSEEQKSDTFDEKALVKLSKDQLIEKWKANPVLKSVEFNDKLNFKALKDGALAKIKGLKPEEKSQKQPTEAPKQEQGQPKPETTPAAPEGEETPIMGNNKSLLQMAQELCESIKRLSFEEDDEVAPNPTPEQNSSPSEILLKKINECSDRNVLIEIIQILTALMTQSSQKTDEKINVDEYFNKEDSDLIKLWNLSEILGGTDAQMKDGFDNDLVKLEKIESALRTKLKDVLGVKLSGAINEAVEEKQETAPKEEKKDWRTATKAILKRINKETDKGKLIEAYKIVNALLHKQQTTSTTINSNQKDNQNMKNDEKKLSEAQKVWNKSIFLKSVELNEDILKKNYPYIKDMVVYVFKRICRMSSNSKLKFKPEYTESEWKSNVPESIFNKVMDDFKASKSYKNFYTNRTKPQKEREAAKKKLIAIVKKTKETYATTIEKVFPEIDKILNLGEQPTQPETETKQVAQETQQSNPSSPTTPQNESFLRDYFSVMGIKFTKILED